MTPSNKLTPADILPNNEVIRPMSEEWRQWSKRYATRRRWRPNIGSRFRLNCEGAGLVFEIVAMSQHTVWFVAPGVDKSRTVRDARKLSRARFRSDLRRGRIVNAL
jgi:hypothetical protein